MMGIRLQYASNWNKISNFTSSNNQYGLEIDESYYNNITQNEFSTNEYGLYLHTLSFDNLIWENQILNNSFHQALDNSGINQWNFSGRGNFWSDYRDRYPSAIDLGGYWDTPYSINGSRGAQDNYPLLISLVTPDSPSILTTNQTITNTSLTIEWTTVSDATSYNVYVNGTLNATTSFTQQLIGLHTNNTYEITVSAMNYEVESDQSLAISIIVAIPPVDDEENPSWLETPQNQEVEYGTSFIYDLNATDNVAIDEYWLDDIVNFQIDINGIITNISTLFPGNYNLEIFVNDTSNNIISSLIQISCVDNEAPNWIETPENQELEYGEPFMYDLNATDNVAIDEYWLDDIVNFQIDINGIITNISTLFPGYYNLEIFVNDTSNNIISSMIQISCVDNEAPKWIETPQNQVVEYGAPFIYDVNASDNFAIEEYSLNDTTYFDIDLVGVITNATILIPGTYFLEITARDIGNNQITYEISITVNPEPNSQERRKIPAYPVGFLTIWIIIAIGLLMKKSLRFQDNLST
jgi:parallel beta-helix repeat protein